MLQQRLEGALAQCVFCLYGVDLPWRDEYWGGIFEVRLVKRAKTSVTLCPSPAAHDCASRMRR